MDVEFFWHGRALSTVFSEESKIITQITFAVNLPSFENHSNSTNI